MRIALTHPTCWPWVRRGSERLLNDLGQILAQRGHDVTIISSSPEGAGERQDGDVRVLLVPQRLKALSGRRLLSPFHAFALDCKRILSQEQFDAVHCLNYHDAWGALAARSGTGNRTRIVYQMTGIPVRRYFRRIPIDAWMFRHVVREVDAMLVLSRFACASLRADFGRDGVLLPSPTVTTPFENGVSSPANPPRILFVGDVNEIRKGAHLLPPAFATLRAEGRALELHFSGNCTPERERQLRDLAPGSIQDSIVFHGVGQVSDLPELYAQASVVVNPAIWEALGNVLIEALAAGRPVVGCAHGGIPDIIHDESVGALFDPRPMKDSAGNIGGLVDALRHGLQLSERAQTADRCRARARDFSWEKLAPTYEALLAEDPTAEA